MAETSRLQYWLTPPELELEVRRILGGDYYDPSPYPCPVDRDALRDAWVRPWYCNPPFVRADGSPSAFARKAVCEGGPGVFATSVPTPVATLLRAGARFVDARRVRWLEVESREPMPNPGLTGLFCLPEERL